MSDVEKVVVDKKQVSCDGGKGALGHPKVYLNMGDKDFIECPYCGKNFLLKKEQKTA